MDEVKVYQIDKDLVHENDNVEADFMTRIINPETGKVTDLVFVIHVLAETYQFYYVLAETD